MMLWDWDGLRPTGPLDLLTGTNPGFRSGAGGPKLVVESVKFLCTAVNSGKIEIQRSRDSLDSFEGTQRVTVTHPVWNNPS